MSIQHWNRLPGSLPGEYAGACGELLIGAQHCRWIGAQVGVALALLLPVCLLAIELHSCMPDIISPVCRPHTRLMHESINLLIKINRCSSRELRCMHALPQQVTSISDLTGVLMALALAHGRDCSLNCMHRLACGGDAEVADARDRVRVGCAAALQLICSTTGSGEPIFCTDLL